MRDLAAARPRRPVFAAPAFAPLALAARRFTPAPLRPIEADALTNADSSCHAHSCRVVQRRSIAPAGRLDTS